jgi:hypothetical protein
MARELDQPPNAAVACMARELDQPPNGRYVRVEKLNGRSAMVGPAFQVPVSQVGEDFLDQNEADNERMDAELGSGFECHEGKREAFQ